MKRFFFHMSAILISSRLRQLAFILLYLHLTVTVHAQGFTVVATPTHATCTSLGAINMSVQNANAGTPVIFKVYRLPDTSTAIFSGTETTIPNLEAGTYEVEASQQIAGNTVTASTLVLITTPQVPLEFTISALAGLCGGDSKITVNVTSGTPALYEIIAGPVTRPVQTSPEFNNLTYGVYQIRVTDVCGVSVTRNTVLQTGAHFLVSTGSFRHDKLPACNEIVITNTITAGGNSFIPYPLEVRFVMEDITITQILTSGDPFVQSVEQAIPAVPGSTITCIVEAEHSCGMGSNRMLQGPITIPTMNTVAQFEEAGCGDKYLIMKTVNYMQPYTITFTDYPEGFDPTLFNPAYGQPFYTPQVAFGSPSMPAPVGFYQVVITDACGTSIERNLALTPVTQPERETFNNDCVNQLGRARITIPLLTLATAVITDAPDNYGPDIPHDVTSLIDENGVLLVENMPVGDYIFEMTDECGHNYTRQVTIHPFVSSLMEGETRPDCSAGMGTIHMYAQNPPLSMVKIFEAPDNFPYGLPYDASGNINTDGSFYMDGLPEGDYYIRGYDTCSADSGRPFNINVVGYSEIENDIQVTPQCGSFDLLVKYTGTDSSLATLWLQKEVSPGVWGHPATGMVYIETAAPDATNSFAVTAGVPITGLTWLGNFRIIKHFKTYGSGATKFKDCIKVLDEFYQSGSLEVTDIRVVSCPGPTADIEIISNGVAPVNHKIIRRNGISYSVYNFENPIFTDLTPAIYTFEIRDACGGVVVQDFDVDALPPLVVANQPQDIFLCDEGNDGSETFNLTLQAIQILGTQDPDEYTVTFFDSQENADLDWRALDVNYTASPGTVYARVVNNNNTACYATTSFNIGLYATPVPELEDRYAFCENSNVTITAEAGYIEYRWSNGDETQETTISEAGQYTLTVTDANGCLGSTVFEVVASPSPRISSIDITDWTNNNNIISINTEPAPVPQEFEYSIDGINYQQSNTFTGLAPGKYTVYVRDVFDCGSDLKEIYILAPPLFFSPNGDGVNDMWRVEFALTEPGMKIYIYDRYGRMITSFGANDTGWDGTFNGLALPATDYWYLIIRDNGQEFRGHFSLVR